MPPPALACCTSSLVVTADGIIYDTRCDGTRAKVCTASPRRMTGSRFQ